MVLAVCHATRPQRMKKARTIAEMGLGLRRFHHRWRGVQTAASTHGVKAMCEGYVSYFVFVSLVSRA